MEKPRRGVTEFLSVFRDAAARFADDETDLLIMLDSRGCVERVWPGFTKALGYEERDVLGKAIIDLIHAERDARDIASFIKSFGWYMLPGPPFRMLHKGSGLVMVKMMSYAFDSEKRARIILRLV